MTNNYTDLRELGITIIKLKNGLDSLSHWSPDTIEKELQYSYVQDILQLITQRETAARIKEIDMANMLNEQKELDPVIGPHVPYRMRAWFKDRKNILEAELKTLTKPEESGE